MTFTKLTHMLLFSSWYVAPSLKLDIDHHQLIFFYLVTMGLVEARWLVFRPE